MRTTSSMRRSMALAGAALLCLLHAGSALAGGHLDVDDAGTLDRGQCLVETWGGRSGAVPVNALHVGPTCRVGPIELGVNLDRTSNPGTYYAGPQVKWTWFGQEADARFSGAVSANATFDRTHHGKPGRQLVFPFTLVATPNWQIHANIGADWATVTGERTFRRGLGTEWALNEAVSLLAERNRAFDAWTTRIGARFNFTPFTSLDVTTSRTGPEHARGFYVGLNHEFKRP
ncbi:hypothetical protein [Variovorax sp. PAMC28562]|uniref:hypothetical protein n=1 Tax=Variovorax sp. PAMC28562 TaxID=2762323 RepID=UPI0021C2A982|nr:hypothetical protein [Variovorax sp. PAMC28562]